MSVSDRALDRTGATAQVVVLEVTGLSRGFGTVEVIRHVDVRLLEGERLGLTGSNGSGKSTILRCLSGTLTPTSGTVRVMGHVAGSFEARRATGPSLSQERSFYRRLTGFENLLFFARLRHISKKSAVAAVRDVGSELELNSILERRVDRCSTGMIQQLSFARALLGDPRLLLLDEPTRSLDERAIERMWRAIEARDHAAVVLASHISADLERCDQVHELPT